jgi:predicted lipoprotein with Yx(FWY)xxD motif
VTAVAASPTALRIGALAALATAVAVLAAGCGGSSTAKSGVAGARHVTKSATVMTRKVKKLGVILVNSRGRTLYMFVPDHRKRVTCKGTCAVHWPPLKIKKGRRPTAGGAARKKLLGTDKNPGGGRVVTYNRWPLYTYIGDSKPGQTTGQAVKLDGGLWYVLSPAGKVIKKKP